MSNDPAAPRRARRLYVLWSIALALLLALGLFCWLVVVPVWGTVSVVDEQEALSADGSISPPNWPLAIQELGGRERAARRLATYLRLPDWIAEHKSTAFGMLGLCGESAVPPLLGYMNHPDAGMRASAVKALGSIGTDAGSAAPLLAIALTDPEVNVRRAAVRALWAVAPKARSTIAALTAALKDKSQAVCRQALITLGTMGPEAKAALPDVLGVLESTDPVRCADVVVAVAGITRNPRAAADAYFAACRKFPGDSLLLYEITQEMRAIGPGMRALIPLLESLRKSSDKEIAALATGGLRRIPGYDQSKLGPPSPMEAVKR